MFRSPSRTAALLAVPALLLTGLTGCGGSDDNAAGGTYSSLDGVTISGAVGTEPKVEFKGEIATDKTTTEVITEGNGPEVATGDQVLANLWIGDGTTEQKSYSSYDDAAQLVTVDPSQLNDAFKDAFAGQRIGSRVAILSTAEALYGEGGNPQLNVGNMDTVVAVVDIVSPVLDKPEGDAKPAPAWVPQIIEKAGTIKGLGFAKTPAPTDELQVATLIEGTGPAVKKGQLIVVNYLGSVYDKKLHPAFDESYSKEPASFTIGEKKVIAGWDQALVGVPVGSRVVMAVPPDLGYQAAGNPDAGISGTDTLYFVVDILAAG